MILQALESFRGFLVLLLPIAMEKQNMVFILKVRQLLLAQNHMNVDSECEIRK